MGRPSSDASISPLIASASRLGVALIAVPASDRGVKPPALEPREGVAAARWRGVAPGERAVERALGVCEAAGRGVAPPKSPREWSGRLSPPCSGVCRASIAACAAASSSTVSPPPPTRGVRIAACEGVCSYVLISSRVESEPSSSRPSDEALAFTTSSNSRSPTCGGGSISLARLLTAIGSLSLLSCAIASGIASSRRRLIFSASALRALASAASRLGASSRLLRIDLNLSPPWLTAASAAASSPVTSKKPAGGTFWKGISVL
mmetsp:Transcript_37447/g.93133  ORF Transcript_37447/g.93133 Transcript_37447/m.93133 type:complete len:263 (-) Transcript_37447:723-1511(-)